MYEKLSVNKVLAVIIVSVFACLCIELGFKSVAYNDKVYHNTYDEARMNFNDTCLKYAIKYYNNTNALISPLAVERSMCTFLSNNNLDSEDILYFFGNGTQHWEMSVLGTHDDSIQCFSTGESKEYTFDITHEVSDGLLLDEINAKIQTLSEGSVVTKITQDSVKDTNLYSICSIDEKIGGRAYLGGTAKTVILRDFYEYYSEDNLYFVKMPLGMEDRYELFLIGGSDLDKLTSALLFRSYSERSIAVEFPILSVETSGSPVNTLKDTYLVNAFDEYPVFDGMYFINHLSLTTNSTTEVYDGDCVEFLSNFYYLVYNNETGNIVLIGHVL